MCLKNTRLLIHYFFLSVLRADQNHPVGSVESVQRWNNNLGSSPACFRAFFSYEFCYCSTRKNESLIRFIVCEGFLLYNENKPQVRCEHFARVWRL